MRKVVFIAGLGHSGSTMLDMALGAHPRLVGLGEIHKLLRPELNRMHKKALCSCGEVIDNCPFWKEAAKYLRPKLLEPMFEKYETVLNIFEKIYGDDYVLVDSSKSLEALKVVLKIPDIELRIVHLLRDVRGWAVSRLDYRKRLPQHYSSNGNYFRNLYYSWGIKSYLVKYIIPYLTRMASYYFFSWYYYNNQMTKFLEEKKANHYQMGYDELGMDPERMMGKLLDYIGVDSKKGSLSSVNTKSHILVGNPKKTAPERRKGILYDNRWMYRNDWILAAAIFKNIMKYNSKNVYKNIQNESIWGT